MDILNGRLVALEPRLQRLTVLFCDLRDYTTLSEAMPPGELVELLNEWFSEATRAVRRHGGIVDKFIGDAVMALFGVPDERDDAAADAVRAALDMRDALSALNLRQQVLGGPTLRIGVQRLHQNVVEVTLQLRVPGRRPPRLLLADRPLDRGTGRQEPLRT